MLHHITNGILAAGLLTAVAITGVTHDTPLGGYVGGRTTATRTNRTKPSNTPDWEPEYAVRFAGCADSLPSGVIPATVVAVKRTGDVIRMDFDQAWTATHNTNHADDVWIVGACA